MSFDVKQFHQVFFEEAHEHLDSMEKLLLGINIGAPDPDEVNAIFRAAHSIKGGSATFGFADVAELTHALESMLDKVRKNELALTAEMVDVSLLAGDALKNYLAGHRDAAPVDRDAGNAVIDRLKAIGGGSVLAVPAAPANVHPQNSTVGLAAAAAAATAGPPVAAAPGAPAPPPAAGDAASEREFEVIFRPHRDGSQDEFVRSLLDEMARFATVSSTEATAPDGQRTVSYRVRTRADQNDLVDILEFVAAPEQYEVRPLSLAIGDVAEEGDGYGLFVTVAEAPPVAEEGDGFGFFVDPQEVRRQVSDAAPDAAIKATLPVEPAPSAVPHAPVPHASVVAAPVVSTLGVNLPVANAASPRPAVPPAPTLPTSALPTSAQPASAPPAPPPPVVADAAAGINRGRRQSDREENASIRVGIEKVDQLINLVGELVITHAMLAQTVSTLDPVLHEKLLAGMGQLERNSRDLQESVLSIRMMPIGFVFSRFPRMVRDLAGKLGKKIELETIGEGTELDKGVIEKISDPLTHLVRNCIDHGIEMPDQRIAAGKPEIGRLTLQASHRGGNIVVEVADDGAGLSRPRILAKARQQGIPISDNASDAEVWGLIFAPGFSTAEVVTDVSGRGVGMDVVKRNIEAMGGRVEIWSASGKGCRMTIRLPLTLAILDGMSVGLAGQTYVIPLTYIVESIKPDGHEVKTIKGASKVINVRGDYLPIVELRDQFNIHAAGRPVEQGVLVIVESDGRKAALLVDELLGQHQVVIKNLETNYRRVSGVSGATIMGDGHVALILDAPSLISLSQRRGNED